MLQFVGYDFFSGPNALACAPGEVADITSTKLSNGIFDHFNITHDIMEYDDMIKPEDWSYDTVLNATFNGTISAGNLDYMVGQITGIKIKRRKKGSFDWLTLKYLPINKVEDLSFVFNDFLNACNIDYEYALVPVAGSVEGNYIINSIMSKFTGVFIGDEEQSFKFLYDVSYGSNARNQQIGTFQPLGKKFPIIVANGILSYESGSVTASILNDSFESNGIIDRGEIIKTKDKIKNFLTNHKPKILKDWNGNIWLVMIVDNVQMNYKEGSGMGIPQVQFNWVEVGSSENQQDLYDNGITNIPVG